MIDAVEIINRFTEFNPSKGEEPLPLPIPGHWFRKICALADRIAAAENANEKLRAELVEQKAMYLKTDREYQATVDALRAELAQAKGEIARLHGIIDIRVDSESQYPGGE